MTTTQIQLVRDSFAKIEPMAVEAGTVFYRRLLSEHPEFRQMFRATAEEHGRTLMNIIALAVSQLDNPELLRTIAEELGRRHADDGVSEEHYVIVAAVLLATLADALGESFTPDVKAAWTDLYLMLALVMIRAQHSLHTQPVAA